MVTKRIFIAIDRSVNSKYVNIFKGLVGERGGNRTHDPLIKSQMLYLLSYALSPCATAPRAYSVGPRGSIAKRGSLKAIG